MIRDLVQRKRQALTALLAPRRALNENRRHTCTRSTETPSREILALCRLADLAAPDPAGTIGCNGPLDEHAIRRRHEELARAAVVTVGRH